MESLHSDTIHSMRRSHGRFKIWMFLVRSREASIAEISRATGIRDSRVRAGLIGRRGTHRRELSLLALGLAKQRTARRGRVYAITPAGLAHGRRMARGTRTDPLVREFADLAGIDDPDADEKSP